MTECRQRDSTPMTSSPISRRSLISRGSRLGIAAGVALAISSLPTTDVWAATAPGASTSRAAPASGPIGIVVAMEDELHHLLARADLVAEDADGPWPVLHLSHTGLELRVSHSGIGSINAAACTSFLLATHPLRAVLNYGSAGAHVRDLLPGDVVIGTATVNQSTFVVLPSGDIFFPDADAQSFGETIYAGLQQCDAALVALAQASAAGWTPSLWPADLPWPEGVPRRDPVVATGVVASADIWNQFPARIDALHAQLNSLCEDMEAAAINQVCHTYGVPFLTVRDISNNELLAASQLQGEQKALPATEVGKRSAALVLRLLDAISS